MKVQLLSTKNGMKSGSLKRLAVALTETLGYKVWRTTKVNPKRKQLRYGDAVNKLEQYQWFKEQGISALEFTTSKEEAIQWQQDGLVVFGRRLLNASCGHGIVICVGEDKVENLPTYPVYTKYKKKKREFRVHVFKDTVVAVVEKKRKAGWEGQRDTKIRNLANGYVFCQDIQVDQQLLERIHELSLKASKVTTSDFKGVDLGYNEKFDDLFVIEVNSMPGIEGSNVNKYIEVICNEA